MALATMPGMSAALESKPLLTVSGRIGRVNNDTTKTYDFTESDFLKLTQASITTGTSWTPTSVFLAQVCHFSVHFPTSSAADRHGCSG